MMSVSGATLRRSYSAAASAPLVPFLHLHLTASAQYTQPEADIYKSARNTNLLKHLRATPLYRYFNQISLKPRKAW